MIEYEKAQKILQILESKGLTLGSVESLTGGLFSATICAIPGASKCFMGGLVTYNEKEKTKFADVDPLLITKYGVVSQQVANAMAIGGRKRLGVDVCVSFTGNAGPTSEPGKAPVGRVNMAISTKNGIVEFEANFTLTRNEIREACVNAMLDKLITIFD